MTRTVVAACLLLAVAVPASAQDDQRAKLLAQPKYAKTDVRPVFRQLSVAEVKRGVLVVSSRNYAFFGFNTPEVQLYLPDVDNSVYAEIDMGKPKLDGGLEYELERGLFDAEERMDEVRFLKADGSGPAEFHRVAGTIKVRYPLAVSTRTFSAGKAAFGIKLDGPFVELVEGAAAEAPTFSPLEAVRAYDSAGRRLEKASWSSSRYVNGVSSRVLAFHGQVAKVEVDRVSRWVDVEVSYDLPPVPPLPKERAGLAPEGKKGPKPTPGGHVTVSCGKPYDAPALAPPTPTPAATPTPRPRPTRAPARRTAKTTAKAPVPKGPAVRIPPRGKLSGSAQRFAAALDALMAEVPKPPAIVQLVSFGKDRVSVSVSTGSGKVEEYSIRDGKVKGPRAVDTRWLNCKGGLAPGALDVALLPALWDDAVARLGKPGVNVSQIIVGQYPCGSAFINVSFGGAGSFKYNGAGRPLDTK
ncbi:MAG: hypothetical protein LJE95_03685 [Acidobacteria bacterium]|nr:hypothetical protein [Acidobacteriota bacterium]